MGFRRLQMATTDANEAMQTEFDTAATAKRGLQGYMGFRRLQMATTDADEAMQTEFDTAATGTWASAASRWRPPTPTRPCRPSSTRPRRRSATSRGTWASKSETAARPGPARAGSRPAGAPTKHQ